MSKTRYAQLITEDEKIYKGCRYKVYVYDEPRTTLTPESRSVYTQVDKQGIKSVLDTEKTNPTSILPWRNPQPRTIDKHVEDVVLKQQDHIDAYLQKQNNAR